MESLVSIATLAILVTIVYFITKDTKTMDNTGYIKDNATSYDLFDAGSTFVASYARRRDAVRGATRRGINLAA